MDQIHLPQFHFDSLKYISGAQILLISLAPSSNWDFRMSIIKLNVKRAPEISTIFESQWLYSVRRFFLIKSSWTHLYRYWGALTRPFGALLRLFSSASSCGVKKFISLTDFWPESKLGKSFETFFDALPIFDPRLSCGLELPSKISGPWETLQWVFNVNLDVNFW